ncbi:MAG: hypothetical protein HOF01_10690 [Chloroflexi bacterium]|nr:hypothetical protein [Chloroflexota bacterium]
MTSSSNTPDDIGKYVVGFSGARDQVSVVVHGSMIIEKMLADLLYTQMPNYSKKSDPLYIGEERLSIAVMCKWAYALGLVDKQIYNACKWLSKLRNSAAHLKSGPVFDYTTADESNWIENILNSLQADENKFAEFEGHYGLNNVPVSRQRFDFALTELGYRINSHKLSIEETKSTR